MTPPIRVATIVSCSIALAWAWASGGYPLVAPWIALLGLLWILAGRRWAPAGYIGLSLAVLAAAGGEIMHLAPVPLLLALALGLAAWDLEHLSRRLALAAHQDDILALERGHFARLGPVLLAGTGLSLGALVVRGVHFNFETAGGLALLAAWALTFLIVRLRRAR